MVYRPLSIIGSLLLTGAVSCVLTTPDLSGPRRELRTQQNDQAQRAATAFCAAYYSCNCEKPYPVHDDEAQCIDHIAEVLLGHLEQGFDDELEYDPECLDANIEMLEAIGCASASEVVLDTELQRLFDVAMRCRTYSGDLTLHEECTPLHSSRGGECAAGLACHEDLKLCFDDTPIPEGEPCDDEYRTCDSGLWCEWAPALQDDACIRPVPVGGACLDNIYCQVDTWCDPTDFTCKALPRDGELCETVVEGSGCAIGHRCALGVCVLMAQEGDSCGDGCGLALTCDIENDICEKHSSLICDLEESLP